MQNSFELLTEQIQHSSFGLRNDRGAPGQIVNECHFTKEVPLSVYCQKVGMGRRVVFPHLYHAVKHDEESLGRGVLAKDHLSWPESVLFAEPLNPAEFVIGEILEEICVPKECEIIVHVC